MDAHSHGTSPGPASLHHPHGSTLDPGDVRPGQHAFVMVGKEALFAVHLTMFDHEEHCYQIILRISIPEQARQAYRKALEGRSASGVFTDTCFLANDSDDKLLVPALQCGDRRAFKARIYRGVPKVPKSVGWPWSTDRETPHLIMKDVPVNVERVVFYRHFDFALERQRHLSYLLFGEGNEAHLTNFQIKEPDYDHVASLVQAPSWLPEIKLRAGANVMFEVPAVPRDGVVYCSDPLPPAKYPVRYQGQAHDKPRDVTLAKTWWFATEVVNSRNPCAAHDCAASKDPRNGGAHAGH